jgi:hypothetical protein
LKDIITCFENLTSTPNICEAIDGTHIPLVDLPSKRITLVVGDFSIGKTLLEILSYATIMFATGMQLPVACKYLWFFMQLQWIFAPFLGVYVTMVQL